MQATCKVLAQLGALSWVGVTNSSVTDQSGRSAIEEVLIQAIYFSFPQILRRRSQSLYPLVSYLWLLCPTVSQTSFPRISIYLDITMRFSIVATIATLSATVLGQGNLANIPTCAVCTAPSLRGTRTEPYIAIMF